MIFPPKLYATGRRIGYARVSTPDQRLDMQIDALKEMECDVIYTDHGVSGGKSSRPGLDKALKDLLPGDVLIVFKLDRLGRSVLHLADLLTRFDAREIDFCSLSERLHTTTPGGRLVFHVIAAMAEFQRDLIRDNTIQGLDAARRRGAKLGRPYTLDADKTADAHWIMARDSIPLDEMAHRLKVSPGTLKRAFLRLELDH